MKAYKDSKELGLFRLFVTRSWFQAMRKLVNTNLTAKGLPTINKMQFNAHVGIEMVTSLVSVNDLKDYWSDEMFCGQADFKNTMSRDNVLHIRSNVVLCHPSLYDHHEASNDTIWYLWKMLEHVQKNIASVAVPFGSITLDEAGFRTKARTKARSYIPTKPDKYAVRMYCVVGTQNSYCPSIVNNSPGYTTSISPAKDYCHFCRKLWTPFNRVFNNQQDVDKNSPSALWVLMMVHQTKTWPDPSGKWIFSHGEYLYETHSRNLPK